MYMHTKNKFKWFPTLLTQEVDIKLVVFNKPHKQTTI